MEHDFIVNVENIDELRTKLGEAKEALEQQVIVIYNQIDSLENSWSGDSYNTFKEKCESFHPTLNALVALLGGFQTMLDNQIINVTADSNLVSEVKSALEMGE